MTAAKLIELVDKAKTAGGFEAWAALGEYMGKHAQDFIKLIEAAEQEHGGMRHEPECPICVALAAFKEKS